MTDANAGSLASWGVAESRPGCIFSLSSLQTILSVNVEAQFVFAHQSQLQVLTQSIDSSHDRMMRRRLASSMPPAIRTDKLVSLDQGRLFVGHLPPRTEGIFSTPWSFRFMDGGGYYFGLVVPLWLPTLMFGIACSCAYMPLYRRRKRKKLGLCLKCGYDLRASKERCPECGTPFDEQLNKNA